MKLTHFIAAGLVLAGVGVSAEASAQRYDGYGRDYREYRGDRGDRGWDRGWDRRDDRRWDRRDRRWDKRSYRRHYGWNRGRHYGWRNNRDDCRIVYRYGQRRLICR